MAKRKGQFLPIFALVILICSYFLSLSVMQGAREISKIRVIASYEVYEAIRRMAKSALEASLAVQTQGLEDFNTRLKDTLPHIVSRKPATIELLSSSYSITDGIAEARAKFKIHYVPLKLNEVIEHYTKLEMKVISAYAHQEGGAWKVEVEIRLEDEHGPMVIPEYVKAYYRTAEGKWKELSAIIHNKLDGSFVISSILDEYPDELKVVVEDIRGIKVEVITPVR